LATCGCWAANGWTLWHGCLTLEHIAIKRITKADYTGHIEALEKDLLEFAKTVRLYESKLRKVLAA
jgi:hypothetical protein